MELPFFVDGMNYATTNFRIEFGFAVGLEAKTAPIRNEP